MAAACFAGVAFVTALLWRIEAAPDAGIQPDGVGPGWARFLAWTAVALALFRLMIAGLEAYAR